MYFFIIDCSIPILLRHAVKNTMMDESACLKMGACYNYGKKGPKCYAAKGWCNYINQM